MHPEDHDEQPGELAPEVQQMKNQVLYANKQLASKTLKQTEILRKAEIKEEISKHKEPQVKRSVSFLMERVHEIEDCLELISEAASQDESDTWFNFEVSTITIILFCFMFLFRKR